MPKLEKTIDGFAVPKNTTARRSAAKPSNKAHTPKNLKKSSRTSRPATPSRSLSGITTSSRKKSAGSRPALAPAKKPATPLSKVQPTSNLSSDFSAPQSSYIDNLSSGEERRVKKSTVRSEAKPSLSDSADFFEEAGDFDEYTRKVFDETDNPEEGTNPDSAELEDDMFSELTPEEARKMRKKRSDSPEKKSNGKFDKKAAKESKRAAKEAEKKAKKKSPVKTAIKIILLILLLALIGGGIFVYRHYSDIIARITGGNDTLWSAIGTMTSETYEPLKTDSKGRTNILIFGTSGYSMSGDLGDGYEHDGAQLTDSIMVASLDQESGDVAMVSLPRDLKAGYTCTATGKINEVYWCANQYGEDELAGATALKEKVQEILGIEIQYYAHLNWGALVSLVDTLGGVDLTLDEDIADYGWTDAVYSAGVEYHLNGEEALGLARARHGTANGDFTRANSQQKILIAIKDKVIEEGLGLSNALSIVETLGDNLRTNLSTSDLKTGMHIAETTDLSSIRQVPLVSDDSYYMTTANINGISYVVPAAGVDNYTAIQEYVDTMFNSNPLEREAAKIEVLNGSGVAGAASSERTKLEAEGFRVQDIGDAPEGTYPKITLYDTSEGKKPSSLAALEKYYGVTAVPESDLPTGVSGYGIDFIIILGGTAEQETVNE